MSLEDALTFLDVWCHYSAGSDGTLHHMFSIFYISHIDSRPFNGFGALWGLLRFLWQSFTYLIFWFRFFFFTSDGIFFTIKDMQLLWILFHEKSNFFFQVQTFFNHCSQHFDNYLEFIIEASIFETITKVMFVFLVFPLFIICSVWRVSGFCVKTKEENSHSSS